MVFGEAVSIGNSGQTIHFFERTFPTEDCDASSASLEPAALPLYAIQGAWPA